jgi:hypothetical protein
MKRAKRRAPGPKGREGCAAWRVGSVMVRFSFHPLPGDRNPGVGGEGVESIPYTFWIRGNGEVLLCNDLGTGSGPRDSRAGMATRTPSSSR